MSDPQNPANTRADDDKTGTADDNNAAAVVTYYGDILPLFRPMDIQCMRKVMVPPDPNPHSVLLANYQWLSTPANAQLVLDHLTGDAIPQMPFGGPYWSRNNIDLFKAWMQGGFVEGQPDEGQPDN